MPPSLPSIVTPSLLSAIRGHPQLPRHTWYFIAGVTLSALNRPDEIPKVYRCAIENVGDRDLGGVEAAQSERVRQEEQLRISRKLREGLVKSAAITGLPKTINALLALKAATPPSLLDEPMAYSPSARPVEVYDMPSSQILHRGQKFFDRVYGKVSKRVMGQMDRSGTEDLGVTARLMYGYLLSNVNVLSAVESSYVLIAGLVPQDVSAVVSFSLLPGIRSYPVTMIVASRPRRSCYLFVFACGSSFFKALWLSVFNFSAISRPCYLVPLHFSGPFSCWYTIPNVVFR